MTEMHKKTLQADFWMRRLDQTFQLGDEGAKALAALIDLPVVSLAAQVTPCQPYDSKLLTFRGSFHVLLARDCVVSLEAFEEAVSGAFERSYRLTPSAPAVPKGEEEAEDFPQAGLSLIDMLGDEVALTISPFPHKPGAQLPDYDAGEATASSEARAGVHPFAVLEALKK